MVFKDTATAMQTGQVPVKRTAWLRGSYCSPAVRRFGRQVRVARAEVTAENATIAPDTRESRAAEAPSACPFLASLPARPPPLVHMPWLKRFNQLFRPQQFQADLASAANGDNVVQVGGSTSEQCLCCGV
jgi:hypothetical protein